MSEHEPEQEPEVEAHVFSADPDEPPSAGASVEPDDDEPDFELHQFHRR
jgi:hypothetical protein